MSSLQTITIEGQQATVGFLSEIGGELVDPKDATFAIARFEDGSHAYYVLDKNSKPEEYGESVV